MGVVLDSEAIPAIWLEKESDLPSAWERAPEFELMQSWQDQISPDFRSTRVKLIGTPEALWIQATIEDDEIFTRAVRNSERFWELSDVFEIFLQASGADHYVELHTTPPGYRLHLKFTPEDFHAVRAGDAVVEDFQEHPPKFEGSSRPVPGGWRVEKRVPWDLILPGGAAPREAGILASFCRYDAFSDGRPPVLSSSSPHPVLNFHRREEWRPLCF